MNQAEFQIEWLTAEGQRIDWLTNVGPFEYTKALNFEGDFSITLPPNFPFSTIAKDQRIRIQRRLADQFVRIAQLRLDGL